MSIPIFYSEKLNCHLQYLIHTHLDKATRNSQCLRLPSFIAMSASCLTHLLTRVSGLGELVIRSLGLIFISSSSDNRYTWNPLAQAIKQTGDIIAIVPSILVESIVIAGDPRFYIAMHAESVKVDIAHLEAGTLNTEEHKRDSDYAIGRAKKKSISH